jgi:hypothetical protein
VWRVRSDPGNAKTGGTLEIAFYFSSEHFPDTESASEAVARDIVHQYPDAKSLSSLAQMRALLPRHPGSGYEYRAAGGVVVFWSLAECSGDCGGVGRAIRQKITRYAVECLGLPMKRNR